MCFFRWNEWAFLDEMNDLSDELNKFWRRKEWVFRLNKLFSDKMNELLDWMKEFSGEMNEISDRDEWVFRWNKWGFRWNEWGFT